MKTLLEIFKESDADIILCKKVVMYKDLDKKQQRYLKAGVIDLPLGYYTIGRSRTGEFKTRIKKDSFIYSLHCKVPVWEAMSEYEEKS